MFNRLRKPVLFFLLSYGYSQFSNATLLPISNDILLNMTVADMVYRSTFMTNQAIQAFPHGMTASLVGNLYDGTASDRLKNSKYDFHGQGELIAADVQYNPYTRIGALLQWNQARAKLMPSSSREEGLSFAPYVHFIYSSFYTSLLAGYGRSDFHLNREISNVLSHAYATSNANQYVLYTQMGYNYPVGAWQVGPDIALQYLNLKLNSYNETGASTYNLQVEGEDAYSLRANVGAHLNYHGEIDGMQVVPTMMVSYVNEFSHSPNNMHYRYVNNTKDELTLNLLRREQHFVLVDTGIDVSTCHWKVSLHYIAQSDPKNVINGINAEASWNFA